jgi:hypothetical protein
VTLVIRRITIAVLAAFLAGAVLAVPASSKSGPATVAKKKGKKCKKGKKGKKSKKRKGCKRGGSSVSGLPGEATPSSPKQPNQPPPPPGNPVLQVKSLALTAGTVLGGTSTSGQVTIDQAAPAGGQEVNLNSTLPARAQVPASVVVTQGQKTASFQVVTTSGPSPVTATLTASIGASTATAALKVVDKPSVASVKLERKCFTPGAWSANRVTLDIPAPDDTDVTLESSDPLSLSLPVTTVTVPQDSTSAFFTVNALGPSDGDVTVTAAAPSTPPQGDSASVYDNETYPDPEAAGLTLEPDTVKPDDPSTATVTLDCEAPAGGTEVTLISQDQAHVGVPATVKVPAGERSFDFQVTTQPDTPDDVYRITATAGGVPVHADLTVSSVLAT